MCVHMYITQVQKSFHEDVVVAIAWVGHRERFSVRELMIGFLLDHCSCLLKRLYCSWNNLLLNLPAS